MKKIIYLHSLASNGQRKIRGEFIRDHFVQVCVNLADAEKYLWIKNASNCLDNTQ